MIFLFLLDNSQSTTPQRIAATAPNNASAPLKTPAPTMLFSAPLAGLADVAVGICDDVGELSVIVPDPVTLEWPVVVTSLVVQVSFEGTE